MTDDRQGATLRETLFETWREYERVAMHFNDLLIRLRSQALAAIGGFATIAGVLLKSAEIEARIRWEAMAAVFVALSILWVAIAILDGAYYSRLLTGAVRALVAIEKKSAGALDLSTEIERAVRPPQNGGASADTTVPAGWSPAIWTFYALVLVVLVAAVTVTWRLAAQSSFVTQALPHNVVRPAP